MKNTFSQNFSLVCCVFAANPRLENSGGCSHTCIDIFVGHICTCPHGFQIGDDARIYQGAVDRKLLRYILKIGILTLMLDFTTGMGSSRTVLNLEDSSRTKSRGLGLDLEEYIYLLSVVFTVAVRVTRTVQGSWFACLTLWSKSCKDRSRICSTTLASRGQKIVALALNTVLEHIPGISGYFVYV